MKPGTRPERPREYGGHICLLRSDIPRASVDSSAPKMGVPLYQPASWSGSIAARPPTGGSSGPAGLHAALSAGREQSTERSVRSHRLPARNAPPGRRHIGMPRKTCRYVDDRGRRPAPLPQLPEQARKAGQCSPSLNTAAGATAAKEFDIIDDVKGRIVAPTSRELRSEPTSKSAPTP